MRKKSTPTFDTILKTLRKKIRNGLFGVGEYLPPERDLSRQLKVNRLTLRKALAALQDEGYLALEPNVGNKVIFKKEIDPPSTAGQKIAVVYYTNKGGLAFDGFYGGIAVEFMDQAREQYDFLSLLMSVPQDVNELATVIQQENIQGIITLGVMQSELIRGLKSLGVPVVSLDYSDESLGIDSVVIDDFGGGYKATSLLLDLGHKHIGFIGAYRVGKGKNQEEEFSSTDRQRGYEVALRERGIQQTYIIHGRPNPKGGTESMEILMNQFPELTAVFTFGDPMAAGASRYIREKGIRVPEEFSIIGFGDDRGLGELLDIPLTTVRTGNLESIATAALTRLMERLLHPERPVVKEIIPVEIVVRQTSGLCQNREISPIV